MQILHFDWLRYQGTISDSHRVAKFASFSFVFSPNKYFFKLHLPSLLLPFLSDQFGDTKTIRPFALKGHGSIAHSAPRLMLISLRDKAVLNSICTQDLSSLSTYFIYCYMHANQFNLFSNV